MKKLHARDWAVENFEQQKVWRNYLEYFNCHLNPYVFKSIIW